MKEFEQQLQKIIDEKRAHKEPGFFIQLNEFFKDLARNQQEKQRNIDALLKRLKQSQILIDSFVDQSGIEKLLIASERKLKGNLYTRYFYSNFEHNFGEYWYNANSKEDNSLHAPNSLIFEFGKNIINKPVELVGKSWVLEWNHHGKEFDYMQIAINIPSGQIEINSNIIEAAIWRIDKDIVGTKLLQRIGSPIHHEGRQYVNTEHPPNPY